MCRPRRPPLRPRPAPRLPLDPDGRPTLPSQGPRSAGTVAECFGLALADDDAMLVVRSRLRADGPGLPRLPQRMRHRDAFGALTASARRCAPRSGEPASIPKQSSTLAKRPPEPSGAATTAFVTVSKARPNALAISAAGVAMRVYALRAAAHGAVEPYKIILTGQD